LTSPRWINYNARDYLTTGPTGRLRLDWGWLLGIGVIHFGIADQLGLPDQPDDEPGRRSPR
jgi:hypothetical protein